MNQNNQIGIEQELDGYVMTNLTVHRIGNVAQGDMDQVQTVGADKKELALIKTLIDCPEWKALCDKGNEISKAVKTRSFGGDCKVITIDGKKFQVGKRLQSTLKKGVYLTPIQLVTSIQDDLDRLIPEHDEAVKNLCEVWETRKAEAKAKLREQYKESDYWSAQEVARRCWVEYSFLSVNVPTSLKAIKASIFEREEAKAKEKWKDAGAEIPLFLKATMQELVGHLAERLQPEPDGKRKRLHETTVEKLRDFLFSLDTLNKTSDGKLRDEGLAEIGRKAQRLLAGNETLDFKEDQNLRESTAKNLLTIKEELNRNIMTAPERLVLIED